MTQQLKTPLLEQQFVFFWIWKKIQHLTSHFVRSVGTSAALPSYHYPLILLKNNKFCRSEFFFINDFLCCAKMVIWFKNFVNVIRGVVFSATHSPKWLFRSSFWLLFIFLISVLNLMVTNHKNQLGLENRLKVEKYDAMETTRKHLLQQFNLIDVNNELISFEDCSIGDLLKFCYLSWLSILR